MIRTVIQPCLARGRAPDESSLKLPKSVDRENGLQGYRFARTADLLVSYGLAGMSIRPEDGRPSATRAEDRLLRPSI